MLTPCEFCDEFTGGLENSFRRVYAEKLETRFICRSPNFVVVPSLGQVVEGHLLLLPLGHWTALADLPQLLGTEFATLCASISTALETEYGPCLFFEHGVRLGDTGGCGVSHAHMHALPLCSTVNPLDHLKSRFPYTKVSGPSDLAEKSRGLSGYVFYRDPLSKAYLFDTPNLPSQYMRRLLAEAVGTLNWDWRTAGREERLLATLTRLSPHFNARGIGSEIQRAGRASVA